jgi:serralysin
LRNASGEELAYNDDSGGSKNSQITFIATTTGRHYLDARGHKTNIGNYQLSAVTTDFANLTTAQLSSL